MADEFVMPKLGLTMEAGTIVRWLVADGAEVERGQPVLVIVTDKVESEVEATMAGRLHPTGRVGEELACGTRIGWILGAGEVPPVAVTAGAATGIGGRVLASPNARRVAAERGLQLVAITGSGPGGRITSEDVVAAAAASPQPTRAAPISPPVGAETNGAPTPTLATAAARNLADLLGVDLDRIAPSGVDPRLTRDDVAAHVRARLAASGSPEASAGDDRPPLQAPTSVIPFTGMRGTIAHRMTTSLESMAQLTLTMAVDMDGVVADRERRRNTEPSAPSFTDYVVLATAQALVEHPYVNSQVTDEGVAHLPAVHVGLAVAVDDGLIVPVIRNTLAHDLASLAVETARLSSAARDRTLTLDDLQGGTFSVTSLGMFDVDAFTPIVNAPNTAILGVGRLRDDVAWNVDGAPEPVTRLTLSLTWDHRAFDGVPAAEFARSIKRRLEAYR